MPGITRRDSTTRVASPPSPRSSGHVVFADTLVTGISRKLYHEEAMIAWRFEAHAAQCGDYCRHPYAVVKAGRELCSEGRQLAIEVAKLMFHTRGHSEVFYKSRTNGQETRIELPSNYNNTISLLWALDKFEHEVLREQSPNAAPYPTSPKRPSRRTSATHTESPVQVSYDTYTVEPSPRHHRSRRHSKSHSKSHSHDESGSSSRTKRYSYEVSEPWQYSYPR